MLFLKGQALGRNKAKRTYNKFSGGGLWEGSLIIASAVLWGPLGTLTSKTVTDMLSLSGATGLGLVKGGFLNKCSFQLYMVFPALYSALCSMRFYHSLCFVCKPNYHRKCFQKYIVPLKRLEPNVIPMLLSWGRTLWMSTCQSHSCGDLLSTVPLVPSGGWVPPRCVCNLSGHSWDIFLKLHKLFQLHNFWQEQATLRGSSW